MSYYSNPTANAAIGAVDKEIRIMRKRAKQLRQLRRRGLLTPEVLARARRDFVGIHRHLLREALGEIPPGSRSNPENNGKTPEKS